MVWIGNDRKKHVDLIHVYIIHTYIYIYIYIRSLVGEPSDHQECETPATEDRAMCPESEGILYTFADSQARHLTKCDSCPIQLYEKKCIQLCLWKTFFLFSQPKVKPRNRKSSQTNQPWNQLALPRNQALCLLAVGIRDVSSSVLRQLNEAEGERQVSGIHVECS